MSVGTLGETWIGRQKHFLRLAITLLNFNKITVVWLILLQVAVLTAFQTVS